MQIVTARPPDGGEAMTPFGTESDWEQTAEKMSHGTVEAATASLLDLYPDAEPMRVRRFVGARRQAIHADRDHEAERLLREFTNYALIMRGMP